MQPTEPDRQRPQIQQFQSTGPIIGRGVEEQVPPLTVTINVDRVLHLIFRLGFASIFLINVLNAWLQPNDFLKLLAANPLASAIGHFDLMIWTVILSDSTIGFLILVGWKKKFVWALAGLWLIMVTFMKLFYLLG